MGCISCHDPHRLPEPAERVAYYRDRCLACHRQAGCTLPLTERQRTDPADNCTACHMPARHSSNVAHTAITDHRVVRRPDGSPAGNPPHVGPASSRPEPLLVPFHQALAEPGAGGDRELGVALIELVQNWPQDTLKVEVGRRALSYLDAALERRPDDVPALQAKGYALWVLGFKGEALATLQTALAKAPEREMCVTYAASLATALRQDELALRYWERAVALNPWAVRYHYELARALAGRGEWRRAVAECEAALRLNPGDVEGRLEEIRCRLAAGDRETAQARFDLLLGFDPPEKDELRRWFAEQLR
jgi:hypothetical protein